MIEEKNIPTTLLRAAEDTISTFLIEMGENKNNKKIMEFSFLINSFIHFSDELKGKLENLNSDADISNFSKYIYSIIEKEMKLYFHFDEYSEIIGASYILAIDECKQNIEGFEETEIHRNLVLHFLTIIPLQNEINKGETIEQ